MICFRSTRCSYDAVKPVGCISARTNAGVTLKRDPRGPLLSGAATKDCLMLWLSEIPKWLPANLAKNANP